MSKLAEKIRRARETSVEANGRLFSVRRPTDEEVTSLANASMLDIAKRFTIGWDLREIDLIPGGGDVPVPFDSEDFAEWLADQPEYWVPLGEAIIGAYKTHAEKRDSAVKN